MTIKAILFDLDGTLLDTTELIVNSFQHTCLCHLQRDLKPEEVYPYFGKPLRDALEYLDASCVDEMIATFRTYNLQHHDDMVTAFPGVVETIEKLAARDIKLGIVTSKIEKTALRGLRLFALDQYFDVIVGLESTEKHKPDPTPVKLALEKLHIQPHEAIMVGDSPFDLQSARAAGVKTVAVRWTVLPWTDLAAEKPNFILESFKDLVDLI